LVTDLSRVDPPEHSHRRKGDSLEGDNPHWDPVEASEWLRGAKWRWSTWKEKPAIIYDAQTGEISSAVWDHDHCHFCNETAFSQRYDGDLREGWRSWSPARPRTLRGSGKYCVDPLWRGKPTYDTWVCPDCFERLRADFEWIVEARDQTAG
jgi:hypothetical protein